MREAGPYTAPEPWGVFELPDDLAPGELKWIRSGVALPRSFRGLVSEHQTREEAKDARREGQFIREIAE